MGASINDDKLVFSKDGPQLESLIEEFSQATPVQQYWNNVTDNDDVRFARWDNQHQDGLKHDAEDEEAFPWDGASDTRVHLADDIINDNVALCVTSFWRAALKPQGVASDDLGKGETTRQLMEYFMQRQRRQLRREVELSAQYIEHYGWTMLHPTWIREVQLKPIKLTMEEFFDLAEQAEQANPGNPFAQLPELIMDPASENEAMDVIKMLYQLFVQTNLKDLEESEIPEIASKVVRKMVRDLRGNDAATLPMPYLSRNEPSVLALRPYDEVFLRNEVTETERSRVFVRLWMTEEEIRAKEVTEGWDKEWIEFAVKQKGYYSVWTTQETNTQPDQQDIQRIQNQQSDLIEVIYSYMKRLDENMIPGIFCTIFSNHITKNSEGKEDLVAKHELVDFAHNKMPFVAGTRERWARTITSSRGVPQIVTTWQREMKVQRDSLFDRTSFTTLPSILVPARATHNKYRFGPAKQVTVFGGKEPKFMEVPRTDGLALELMREIKETADGYFGRLNESISPQRTIPKQQKMVDNFLMMWEEALKQQFQLIQQYLPDEEWERITGAPKEPLSMMDIGRQYDVLLEFDVREMDVDFTIKKLDMISKLILPEDAAGVIDKAKLVKMKLAAVDPAMARELVSDQENASQQLYDKVRNDISQMFLGNEPILVEKDASAGAKLQAAQEIYEKNPTYQKGMESDPTFQANFQRYIKNLEHSVNEEKNKMAGRFGVKMN